MKNWKITACLMALTMAAGAVCALGDVGFSMGAGVQYWDAKDAKDQLDEDGLLGGNLIFRLKPVEYLGFDLRLGGSGVWDGKTYRVDGRKYETDVTFMCCPAELGLVLMLPLNGAFTIYGGPGVGYYYYDIDIETTTKHGHHWRSETHDHIKLEDDFGWYAVAGLNIQLAPHFSIFGEGRYTDTETSLKHESSAKLDCSGFGVQAGIMIDF